VADRLVRLPRSLWQRRTRHAPSSWVPKDWGEVGAQAEGERVEDHSAPQKLRCGPTRRGTPSTAKEKAAGRAADASVVAEPAAGDQRFHLVRTCRRWPL
jgi:hypothetical protein